MWRKLARAVGCLGYLGILMVIFALVSYFSFSQFVRRGVTSTPDLLGLSDEDAAALLADQGLRLVMSDEGKRYDEEVPAGHVLIQKPRAGTLVKRGVAVTIVTSHGPRRIEVPSVVGEALQAAQVTLTAAGLTVGRTISIYSEQGKSGTVVAQDPAGSSRVERDAAIDLFLSLESRGETYLMPDLIYRNYDDVRRYFENRGFRVGRVSYDPYEGLAPGTVLRQFPLAGRPIQRGDVVALTVVPPKEPPVEPPVEPEELVAPEVDSDGPPAAGEAGRAP